MFTEFKLKFTQMALIPLCLPVKIALYMVSIKVCLKAFYRKPIMLNESSFMDSPCIKCLFVKQQLYAKTLAL